MGALITGSLAILPVVGNSNINTELFESAIRNGEPGTPVSSLSGIRSGFISPPDEAISSCYWWWFNGLINKEGITRDLEEFRNKGMGSVFLVNSAGGLGGVQMPVGVLFLSPEWKELYRYALKESTRLNFEVGVNLCAGWCMGGPWIKPEICLLKN